jgi:predicted GNAT family N-acyltransferase
MNRQLTSVQDPLQPPFQASSKEVVQNPSEETLHCVHRHHGSPRAVDRVSLPCRATDITVLKAATEREREAIYRLRYQVYIEEMNGGDRHQEADAHGQQLRDEWDDRAHHFYAMQQDTVVACARLIMRRDGPLECEEHFNLERFAPFYPHSIAMTSRLALHPNHRGSHLLKQLTCAMYHFAREEDVYFNFIDCHTRLLPLYSKLGYRAYRPGFNHAQYTYVVPMVLVMDDLEYLEQVKSPFVPVARSYASSLEGRHLLLSQFPDAGHPLVPTGHKAARSRELMLQRLLQTGVAGPCNMLDGLTLEDVTMLASLGHYVTCREGDAVLRAGDPGRDIFLIVDGRFQVSGRIRHSPDDEIHVSKTLMAGDVFGEIRFLTEEIRYASVVAADHSTLLVLNARALDRLVISAPKVAAKVFRNIARIVVSRLCPASTVIPDSPARD